MDSTSLPALKVARAVQDVEWDGEEGKRNGSRNNGP